MDLKVARKIARLTQAELATKAGVDQTTISDLENGRIRYPGYETVVKICRVLNAAPEDIFPVADTQEQGA